MGEGDDAERVAGGVGVDVDGLLRIVGSVLEEAGAQRERSFVLRSQVFAARDAEIEVELLWDAWFRPRGRREVVDLLDGEARFAGVIAQDQPARPSVVDLIRWGYRVARGVPEAEQLAVELRQRSGVGRVEDRRHELRVVAGHGSIFAAGRIGSEPIRIVVGGMS